MQTDCENLEPDGSFHQWKGRVDFAAVSKRCKRDGKYRVVSGPAVFRLFTRRLIRAAFGPTRSTGRTGLGMPCGINNRFQNLVPAAGIREHGRKLFALRMAGIAPTYTVKAL